MLALIQNVTGIGLNAFYAPVSSNGDVAESPPNKGFMWQRADGFGHAVRRWIIRRVPVRLGRARRMLRASCSIVQQLGAWCKSFAWRTTAASPVWQRGALLLLLLYGSLIRRFADQQALLHCAGAE